MTLAERQSLPMIYPLRDFREGGQARETPKRRQFASVANLAREGSYE